LRASKKRVSPGAIPSRPLRASSASESGPCDSGHITKRTAPSRIRLRAPFASVIASREKTSPSDLNKGEEQAARAMGSLHKAVAMGYRSPDSYRTEDALDPLRDRDDFRALMIDLAVPAEPFARRD
jgi:hypothetical protein